MKSERGRESESERERNVRAKSILFPVMCSSWVAWVKGVFFRLKAVHYGTSTTGAFAEHQRCVTAALECITYRTSVTNRAVSSVRMFQI